IHRAEHLFHDLDRLELFFKTKPKDLATQSLFGMFASIGAKHVFPKERWPRGSSYFDADAKVCVVGDDLGKGVHAEMRVLHELLASHVPSSPPPKVPYLGITKLCCPSCFVFLSSQLSHFAPAG